MTQERHLVVAVEHREGREEDQRKEVAVEQRHLIAQVQAH